MKGAVTSSMDSQLRVLNLEEGGIEKTIDAGPGEAWKSVYSPNGKHLATGSQEGNINIFDLNTQEKAACIESKGKFVMSVAYVRSFIRHFYHVIHVHLSLLMGKRSLVDDTTASCSSLMSKRRNYCMKLKTVISPFDPSSFMRLRMIC